MAMSLNDSKAPARRQSSRRQATTKPVVPPSSRAATARKLEVPELDELDFELETKAAPKYDPALEAQRQERLKKIATLTEKRDELVERLDIGAAKIEEARAQGKDVSTWEDHWIYLLHQYETICDKLRDMQIELF
jgi:hypothetical protein